MGLDQIRQVVVDLCPDLALHDRRQRGRRQGQSEIAIAHMPGVDDLRALAIGAGQVVRHQLNRPAGRRDADLLRPGLEQRLEARQREREMRAALVAGERVDLVDDDRPDRAQHSTPRVRCQENIERLRRRDEDVRRVPKHARPLALRRISGAHVGADAGIVEQHRGQLAADPFERLLQVFLDVVAERLER